MAGGYEAVKPWSKSYDDRAAALTMVATNFARALQHYGDILKASSYNWKSSEYTANRNPNKGDPPALPTGIPSELPYGAGAVVGIASSGAYTNGLQTDWTELQDKVTTLVTGGQVPDGDTDKLARAATMWRTFANSDPLEYGVARLQTVASGLEKGFGTDVPDDIPNHAANLRKLADKLREIRTAAHDIATAAETHNTALAKMRADINTQFAAVVTVTAISIGRSMVNVKEQPAKEKAPSKQQQSPNDNKVDIDIDFLNDAAWAIAGPANTFLTTLSTLSFSTATLANGDLLTIVELPIVIATAKPENDVTFTDPRRPHLGGDGKYHVSDGDREVQIDDPNDTSRTITDIDEVKNGVLWEEKSATNAADVDKWIAKQVEKKLGSYIDARQYIDGYEQAPIGLGSPHLALIPSSGQLWRLRSRTCVPKIPASRFW
ncbi:hypothetical protein NN3_52760 [Nocardia neocaledoniensis NBRC 108232]|uniref:Uncharacterized protein n=1 Tax=Nocardia neocaledoniensis TaxID=236511 RepID=A0A317NBD4_9NOCA|nr:hypothetical protein [Nocardia neocaledoniensis]PWV72223.1 hypothetical protein DFR69_109139 [Nocardia neocaledoniensis]GEM34269.1 hypothetical protein NN3_52760 [Nocardia neocaledoniensis NBRC 108232]